MTLRLVAVMSVVLLLCLGAFGLLMAHYQDQVMEEVTRTASVVGRTALRTLERGGPGSLPFGDLPESGAVFFWSDRCGGEDIANCPDGVREIRRHEFTGSPGEGTVEFTHDVRNVVEVLGKARHIRRELTSTRGGETVTVVCEGAAAGSSGESELDCTMNGDPTDVAATLFISVDDVHAESDPAGGLVLKIPTFSTQSEEQNSFEVETIDVAAPARALARLGEIQLPIPVEEDYRELFSTIRRRSMFLFLGVFVVGTALSAGLASHFTRPIRRLDAGIRSLSDGDLSAEVQTSGEDEIARLGRAFNDMTRKLRANRDRSRLLVRKEKLSALGRLAAGVAHDVRNPLHSIGLTLQHLEETGRPESDSRAEEFDRAVGVIRGEIRRLDRLVGNFLGFAASGRGERLEVDLPALLRETVRLVGKEAERRRVEVDLAIDESAPPLRADGEALRSAILNLVLNSFEAMPEGGRLRIALEHDAGELLVEVEDTGCGIPAEDRERVFDFAYTTREEGHGLGLAMVHHCIVEEHGGRVDLDGEPGQGTRVRLVLPLAEPEERA